MSLIEDETNVEVLVLRDRRMRAGEIKPWLEEMKSINQYRCGTLVREAKIFSPRTDRPYPATPTHSSLLPPCPSPAARPDKPANSKSAHLPPSLP
jgi:hypothetical protein